MILGIDPSYTRTGVSVLNPDTSFILLCKSLSVTKKSVYQLPQTMTYANILADQLWFDISITKPSVISIEYPVLATRSGAYLGLIQQALFDILKFYKVSARVFLFPSQAITSVTRCRTKSDLVTWCKSKFIFHEDILKFNHDEASAMVLAHLADLVIGGAYKNSYFELKF